MFVIQIIIVTSGFSIKHIKVSTNKPSTGSAILEISSVILIKYYKLSTFAH